MSKINYEKITAIVSKGLVERLDTPDDRVAGIWEDGMECWKVTSQTNPKDYYCVVYKSDGLICECKSFEYDTIHTPQTCKHCEAVKVIKGDKNRTDLKADSQYDEDMPNTYAVKGEEL